MARLIDWKAELAAYDAALPEMKRRDEEWRKRESLLWREFVASLPAAKEEEKKQ
jgi:hypothetical protein